jgi:hypothetical protein
MKVQTIFIVALLAMSVFADEGVTSDDWHEDTDVQIFEGETHETNREDPGSKIVLKPNEVLVGPEVTVTDGLPPVWQNTTETRLEMKDGKLVNITIIREHRIDKHRKIQTIKTIIHNKVKIDNVLEVVRSFGQEYGQELSTIELELFNTIAITQGNDFQIQYATKQIYSSDLDKTLRKISKLFTVQLDEDDYSNWVDLITNNCTNKYQVFALNTSAVEVNRPDLWTVKTEVLLATCGSENNIGYQLFAWAASKTGSYHRNQYSAENGKTVHKLMTRWLYANMNAMVDCKKSVFPSNECADSETGALTEFSTSDSDPKSKLHASPEDKWIEHADGRDGDDFVAYEKSVPAIPEDTNPDTKLWGGSNEPAN